MWKKKHRCPAPPQPRVMGRISRSLELPMEVLEGLPNLELRGNREAVVEHCECVLEYGENLVRIRAGILTLEFTGRGLRLHCMTDENMVVTGYISGIAMKQGG